LWLNTPAQKALRQEYEEKYQKSLAEIAKNQEIYSVENILAPLLANPDDIERAKEIPELLDQGRKYVQYNYGTIYNQVLDLLEVNPSKKHIKSLCLLIGRKHYASMRPDKNPTIYDEQAIQNDILARS
jgi:hypothetical protein